MGTNIPVERVLSFAQVSNILSSIDSPAADQVHCDALVELLSYNKINVQHLTNFVLALEPTAELRQGDKEVVIAGFKLPNSTTSNIGLLFLLKKLSNGDNQHPWFTHMQIMELHPFTDGNSRLARAVWLWNMVKNFNYTGEQPFFSVFYNQTFERYLGFNAAINGE